MSSPCVGLRARAGLPTLVRYGTACAALAFVLAVVAPVRAQNKFWITTTGGSFATNANWATSAPPGGVGPAPPPGAAEVANFTIGNTYTVTFAGDVTNTGLIVSNGTVTFDLNAFNHTITGPAGTLIGSVATQTGRLTIKDGVLGVDTAGDDITLGAVNTSTGFLTISTNGRLGNGTLDPDLIVGSLGTATFTLESNGRADVAQLNIGQGEGSTGTVSLTSPGSLLDVSGPLIVGLSGNGTLSVQGGSTLNTASGVAIGNLVGGRGTMTVSGAGTVWNHGGGLTVGDAGDAGLSIQTGALVTTAGTVNIGNASTGTGAVLVSGTDGAWNMSGGLNLGISGTGNLGATTGGRINTTGATVMSVNGGESTLVITGAGSRWTSGAVTVGNIGNATVSVNSGGIVNTTGNVIIANTATGTGKVTVSGAGSAWNITGGLTISNGGTGSLTVDTGATVTTTGTLSLLDPGAPNATLNFQGGTITAASFVRNAGSTFNFTDGTFVVSGGSFNNGGVDLTLNGADSDDLPALRLSSGATSVIANMPNLIVGSTRQALAVVSGGSSIQTTDASIGAQDGSTGTLLVEGVNSTFTTTDDLNLGGTETTGGGIGTLTIGNSGTVTVTDRLRLWNGATVQMSGGTLIFNSVATSGGKVNFTSGTIQASANLTASSAVLNALIGPAHDLSLGQQISVPGNTLNLQSDLTVNGGTLSGGTLSISANVNTRVSDSGNVNFTSGITNPSGARFFITDSTVSAGTSFNNSGELNFAGTSATINAAAFTNTGLVSGSGRINTVITNGSLGEIRLSAGQRLEILGSSSFSANNGLIDIDGGTIEFARPLTNSLSSPSTGMIAARNATLRFFGGLTNSGSLTFTSGVSDVFGDVTTTDAVATPGRTGRIVVTGGAQANFFDDVANSGIIQVSASGSLKSTAVFLGSLSGNGVSGTGQVFIEGDMRPGFSPGTMAFGGDLSYGPLASLNIELAGTTPGTQYDRVTVAGDVALAGTLNVSLLGGFKPSAGNTFAILTTGGGIDGSFDNENLPQLSGGLQWNLSYLAQSVSLNVDGVLGDYNLDGTVNTADYVVWRSLLNTNMLVADGSGNGTVDQADYDVWRAHFGEVAVSGSGAGSSAATLATVPEPSTAILTALFAAMSLTANRRKR